MIRHDHKLVQHDFRPDYRRAFPLFEDNLPKSAQFNFIADNRTKNILSILDRQGDIILARLSVVIPLNLIDRR